LFLAKKKMEEEEIEDGGRGVDYQVITDGFTEGY
jgi:hypothetical protein